MKLSQSLAVVVMMLTVATHYVAANTGVDLSRWKPPVCLAQGQQCYRTVTGESQNRFSTCCTENGIVTMACQGTLWWSTCVRAPNGNTANLLPALDPKGPDCAMVSVSGAGTANDSCPSVANLGPLLSKSSYAGEFPLLGSTNMNSPTGRESQIGFLVGGSYNAVRAAEIEGNIVVLGDFKIGENGTNSLGWAGVGSGIFPEEGVFMRVGGNIEGGRREGGTGETWAMAKGSIQYGGMCTSNPANTRSRQGYPNALACGSMFVHWDNVAKLEKTTLDKAPWETMFRDLQAKSKYWYSLKPNGVFVNYRGGPDSNTMVLYAGDTSCLQVFTFDRYDLNFENGINVRLDKSLIGKTILINVSPYDKNGNKGAVVVNNIGGFFDPWGGNDRGFSSVTKRSMLWNFYGATKVTLGPDSGIQFPGSILIPDGDLDMLWPGQDGRTIVKGNVLHNDHGSEFHNYEFDPPCALPLPPNFPVPSCNITPTSTPVTPRPTPAPVAPTPAPVTPRPTPAPVAPTSAPITPMPTPAPVAPTPAPVTPRPTSAPVAPTSAPITPRPTPAPVAPTSAPITPMPTPAPVAPTPAPVTPRPTPAPVAPTSAPITPMPTPAPVAPTPAPVTPRPTPAPVAPTSAPITPMPTPAPVAPTPAPVTPMPTPAPVAPTSAPITPMPTPAPVTPTPAPVTPRPTQAPVAPTSALVLPTPAPVAPTPAPVTPRPTTAPVASTPTPRSACDAAMVSNVASSGTQVAWPAGALTLDPNSSDGKVRFNVTQMWKSPDSISWWNIMEDKNFDGMWDSCVKKNTVPANFISAYEVACRPSGGQVTVQITLHDGSFKNTYNENNSNNACEGWPKGDGVAVYTLTFSCGCFQGAPISAPVAPTPAPVAPTPAPVTPRPTQAPVAPTSAPITPMPTPAPVAPTPAPVTPRPTPAPVAPTSAPITPMPTPAPVAPTPAPVTSRPTPAPVAPTSAPITPMPTPAPVTPTPAPVTPIPTPAPVTPTLAPVTPRPTPAPLTPTPAPLVPTSAPVPPTPAPVAGAIRNSPTLPPQGSFVQCIHGIPGSNVCPEDVVLVNNRTTTFPAGVKSPITILKQEGGNVTFKIANPFLSTVQTMYYEFTGAVARGSQCLAKTNVASCSAPVTVTAQCMHGRLADHSLSNAYALINIWVVDPVVINDEDEIPKCCQPTPKDETTNTVMFIYKVYCNSVCPSDLNFNRMLRGRRN